MLYDKIKKIAQNKGISIYQIEQGAGLSNGLISKWKKICPNSRNVSKVADFLEISIDDLLKGTRCDTDESNRRNP